MGISGKHVAVLVHNYFEQAEFEEPISALKDAGAEVTVITAAKNKSLQGLQHVDKGDSFTADLLLDQATDTDYDALVLPGGAINADHLRMVETAQRWVSDFLAAGKPVAAICHAPWLLVSADVLDGRKLTSYYTIQDDITNAGGEWDDQEVVVDGNLITSRQPDDIPSFNAALIKALEKQQASAVETGPNTIASEDEAANEEDARFRANGYDKGRDGIGARDEDEMMADEDLSDPDQPMRDDDSK